MNHSPSAPWPAHDVPAALRQAPASVSSRSVLQLAVLGMALLFVVAGDADALTHDRLPENLSVRSTALPWQFDDAGLSAMLMQEEACPVLPDAGPSE